MNRIDRDSILKNLLLFLNMYPTNSRVDLKDFKYIRDSEKSWKDIKDVLEKAIYIKYSNPDEVIFSISLDKMVKSYLPDIEWANDSIFVIKKVSLYQFFTPLERGVLYLWLHDATDKTSAVSLSREILKELSLEEIREKYGIVREKYFLTDDSREMMAFIKYNLMRVLLTQEEVCANINFVESPQNY